MKYERLSNTKRNIIFASVFKFITTIMPILIRSIIIRSLGAEYAGLSGLFSSILAVLSVSELGFGSAVVFSMYEPIANDNYPKVGALLGFYKRIYRYVSAFVLIVGLGVLLFLKYLIKGSYPQEINIYYLYLLYLLSTVSSYTFGSYKRSIMTAFQRDDLVSKISTLVIIPAYLFEMFVLLFFKNYYFYVVVMILSNIVINLIISRTVDNKYPQIRVNSDIEKEERQNIFEKVKGLLVIRLLSISRTSSDTIFITAFCGLLTNTIYSNYHMVVMAINGFMLLLTNSITGGIGNGMVINDKKKNYDDFMRINLIYMFVCSLCIVGMVNFYDSFISICFGEKYVLPNLEKYLFCAYFFVISTGNIKGVFINAAGLWDKAKKYVLMDAVCNCVLNFVGVHFWGITGVLLATIISMTVFDVFGVTKVLFTRAFEKTWMSSFIKINLFWAGLLISVLQVGRIHLFEGNGLISSSLSFALEAIILSGVVLVVTRHISVFREAQNLLLALIKSKI